MYRVGFPGWKVASKLGMSVRLRVNISRDEAAGVYIAESPDLDGLIVEATTLEELKREALLGAESLLELALHTDKPQARTDFILRSRLPLAA